MRKAGFGRHASGCGKIHPIVGDDSQMLTHIVVDGFADFTPTEQEILQLLATKLPRMVEMAISLPLEEESRRDDLFSKPRDTLAELQRRHPKLKIDWHAHPLPPVGLALTHLEQNVFDNPRRISPPTECQAIEVIATAGQKAELQWIARQIKTLLVLGDTSAELKSVRPGDIVVVFRRVAPVVALVSEVFSEYGIPAAIEGSVPLARSPLLQALLGCSACRPETGRFDSCWRSCRTTFFSPTGPSGKTARRRPPSTGQCGKRRSPADAINFSKHLHGKQIRAIHPVGGSMAIPTMNGKPFNSKRIAAHSACRSGASSFGRGAAIAEEAASPFRLARHFGWIDRSISPACRPNGGK